MPSPHLEVEQYGDLMFNDASQELGWAVQNCSRSQITQDRGWCLEWKCRAGAGVLPTLCSSSAAASFFNIFARLLIITTFPGLFGMA
jgi:hypothetical protein